MISVALYEPEIPSNAGNIARLCAAADAPLHLIGRLGFSLRHPDARRAGMDYWEHVEFHRHVSYGDFITVVGKRRLWCFSTHASTPHWDAEFRDDDVLLFGPESRGLPKELFASMAVPALRIPMKEAARSLNLASAVAIALYEALRQTRRASSPK